MSAVNYREVKRKANVGDRIKITGWQPEKHLVPDEYRNGETAKVTGVSYGYVAIPAKVRAGDVVLNCEEYVVLETVETEAPAESVQRTLDGLTEAVANLARRLTEAERTIAELKLATSGPVSERQPSFAKSRADVISQAKWDVSELLTQNHPFVGGEGAWFTGADGSTVTDRCEFVINREARTVVALLRYVGYSDNKVWRRGIAKYTPDDVFNTHIGRAISLRRALGLLVPDEYLNVPQPEEVRVGDIVRWTSKYDAESTEILTIAAVETRGDSVRYRFNDGDWDDLSTLTILDDSREIEVSA